MGANDYVSADDKYKYLDAWASMMITIWQDKIAKLNVYSGRKQKNGNKALFDSFESNLKVLANGDIYKIIHTFNYYGRMVDMGVGKNVKIANAGKGSGRRRKPWYNKAYYSSVQKAVEFLIKANGEEFLYSINDLMDGMEQSSEIWKLD